MHTINTIPIQNYQISENEPIYKMYRQGIALSILAEPLKASSPHCGVPPYFKEIERLIKKRYLKKQTHFAVTIREQCNYNEKVVFDCG